MKNLFVFCLTSLLTLSAQAVRINCSGAAKWDESFKVSFSADWVPGQSVKEISLLVDHDQKQISAATLKSYNPRNPAYQGMDRFEIGDNGWSTTSLLLPKQNVGKTFPAYYYDQGHSGNGTIAVTCLSKK